MGDMHVSHCSAGAAKGLIPVDAARASGWALAPARSFVPEGEQALATLASGAHSSLFSLFPIEGEQSTPSRWKGSCSKQALVQVPQRCTLTLSQWCFAAGPSRPHLYLECISHS